VILKQIEDAGFAKGNQSADATHVIANIKGHMFINSRTWKRLTLRHFEKMIDKWAAEHPETTGHQAERQGVSSEHVNGTKGRQEKGRLVMCGWNCFFLLIKYKSCRQ
jgi:hypothetical protein